MAPVVATAPATTSPSARPAAVPLRQAPRSSTVALVTVPRPGVPGWGMGRPAEGVEAAAAGQPSLFGAGEPRFDASFRGLERRELAEGAWIDHQPGWLEGDETLFGQLVAAVTWEHHRRPMYDRIVEVPRLTGRLAPGEADRPELAVLGRMADALSAHYATTFERLGFALYRNGADSVAWHGDQVARELTEALVATVSLGEPRPFTLRPKGGGPSIRYHLGHGDLVVMGGTCQRTWDHAVPKVARAGPRLSVMFRPAWASAWSQLLR